MESLLHEDDIRSDETTDTTRVPAHKVHNFRSDCWIVLKFFEEFPKAVFNGVVRNRYSTTTKSGQKLPPNRPDYRLQRSRTLDPTVGSRLNFL